MANCEICGASCFGDICKKCKLQISSGDNSDIRTRVMMHDNREYDLIREICDIYKIDDSQFFCRSNKQPGAMARHLYIYIAIRNLHLSNKHCCMMVDTSPANVSRIMAEWDRQFKLEIIRKKYESVIKKY